MTFIYILKKELYSCFSSPGFYAILAVFLVVAGYCFYTNLVMIVLLQGTAVPVDLWEATFSDFRHLLMLVLPLVSMRVFAEERKLGTLELLMTSPVRTGDIVCGKYTACLLILSGMLGLTLLYPALFAQFAPVLLPTIVTGYLGVFLLGALFLACGVFISALTESQIVAALATMGVLLAAWFFESFGSFAGERVGSVLLLLSLQKHFFAFVQGVVPFAGIAGFCTLVLCFLFLAGMALRIPHRDLPRVPFAGRHLSRGTAAALLIFARILICLLIFSAVAGFAGKYAGSLDVTPDKRNSLAPDTVRIAQRLTGSYHLTVCATRESRQALIHFLEMFRRSSKNFSFRLLDAGRDLSLATALGIPDAGSGLAEYRQRREVLPAVHEAGIVRSMLSLAGDRARMIRSEGVFAEETAEGGSGVPAGRAHQAIAALGFELAPLRLNDDGAVPEDTALVLIGNAHGDSLGHVLPALERFFLSGGAVMLVLSQQPDTELAAFVEAYNIEVVNAVVVDEHNQIADDIITPLIYIIREHPAAREGAPPALLFHARPVLVGTQPYRGLSWSVLAQSGRGTWADTDIAQAREGFAAYAKDEGDVYGPVSVAVSIVTDIRNMPQAPQGRMVVIGSDAFLRDQFFELLGNRDFFLGALRWLAEDRSIDFSAVRRFGQGSPRGLLRMTQRENSAIFWIAVVLLPLFCIVTGGVVYLRLRLAA